MIINNLHIKNIFVSFIMVILATTFFTSHAQDANTFNTNLKKSDVVEVSDGKMYYVHKVLQKQTLYSIAKLYGVSIDTILYVNNLSSAELQVGMNLRIPKTDSTSQVSTPYNSKDTIVTEKKNEDVSLQSNTTLDRRAQRKKRREDIRNRRLHKKTEFHYSVEESDNQTGTAVIVSEVMDKEHVVQETDKSYVSEDIDTYNQSAADFSTYTEVDLSRIDDIINLAEEHKKTFDVALLLPLYYDNATELSVDDNDGKITSGSDKSFRFIQFYQGALIAIDSLNNSGMNINLHIFDVNENVASAKKLVVNNSLQGMDLIVGPFYKNAYNVICEHTQRRGIPIVNPTLSRRSDICNNQHSFICNSSIYTKYSTIFNFIKQHHADANIVIYTPDASKDADATAKLQSLADTTLDVRIFSYTKNQADDYLKFLSKSKKNIFISLADTYSEVLDNVTKLAHHHNDYDIMLIGDDSWLAYEIDNTHFNDVNFTFCSDKYIDYDSDKVNDFIKKYNTNFAVEPVQNQYAFTGYDVFMFFLTMMYYYGDEFYDYVPYFSYDGLETDYHFTKNKQLEYYENNNAKVFSIKKYMFDVMHEKYFNSEKNDLQRLAK